MKTELQFRRIMIVLTLCKQFHLKFQENILPYELSSQNQKLQQRFIRISEQFVVLNLLLKLSVNVYLEIPLSTYPTDSTVSIFLVFFTFQINVFTSSRVIVRKTCNGFHTRLCMQHRFSFHSQQQPNNKYVCGLRSILYKVCTEGKNSISCMGCYIVIYCLCKYPTLAITGTSHL